MATRTARQHGALRHQHGCRMQNKRSRVRIYCTHCGVRTAYRTAGTVLATGLSWGMRFRSRHPHGMEVQLDFERKLSLVHPCFWPSCWLPSRQVKYILCTAIFSVVCVSPLPLESSVEANSSSSSRVSLLLVSFVTSPRLIVTVVACSRLLHKRVFNLQRVKLI